jgi:hypothetical protein
MIVHELLFVVVIMALKSKVSIIVNIALGLKVSTMMMLLKEGHGGSLKFK